MRKMSKMNMKDKNELLILEEIWMMQEAKENFRTLERVRRICIYPREMLQASMQKRNQGKKNS